MMQIQHYILQILFGPSSTYRFLTPVYDTKRLANMGQLLTMFISEGCYRGVHLDQKY